MRGLQRLGWTLIVCAWGSCGFAQGPTYWPFNPYAGYLSSQVYGYQSEPIPYFALYPPVYYSYPVSAPYGSYRPYALDADYVTTDRTAVQDPPASPQPLRIKNPYVR